MKKKAKPKADGVLFIRFPSELRRQFKAWCSLRDVTMQDKVTQLIRDTVQGKQMK